MFLYFFISPPDKYPGKFRFCILFILNDQKRLLLSALGSATLKNSVAKPPHVWLSQHLTLVVKLPQLSKLNSKSSIRIDQCQSIHFYNIPHSL